MDEVPARLNALFEPLDVCLRRMLDDAVSRPGATIRGLYLDPCEVRVEFDRPRGPASPSAPMVDWVSVARGHPALAALAEYAGLEAISLCALIAALAPETDSRYARAYALLQDDVQRRRPSIALVLALAGGSDPLAQRCRLEAPSGPFTSQVLVRHSLGGPGIEDGLSVDPQVLRLLGFAAPEVDARLAAACRLVPPPSPEDVALLIDPDLQRALLGAARARVPTLHLRTGARRTARAAAGLLAGAVGAAVQEADLAHLGPDDAVLLARDCAFFRRVPLLRLGEAASEPSAPRAADTLARIAEACRHYEVPLLFADPGEWQEDRYAPLGPVTLDLRVASPELRAGQWARAIARLDHVAPPGLGAIAARYSLGAEAIEAAAAEACAAAVLDGHDLSAAPGPAVSEPALARAARRQVGVALGALAQRIEPRRGWDDLVLPQDTITRLHEIAARLRNARRVIEDWGFGAVSRAAHRHAALFAGPSGTGKTLAAEIIAGAAGVDLYRVDLARVVDKYVGETEKNIDRIFCAAEDQDCLLFLDECEVLLGKRSEQREGRDKYANLETAFLLQRIDDFRGTVLMATNLLGNVDEAFIRRLDFVVHFPFPGDAERARLWRAACPPQLPLAKGVDFDDLAARHRLSGGNIANCVLAAAYLAAEDAGPVGQDHLLRAIRREYQKMGQSLDRR